MLIGEICTREVVFTKRDTTILAAAQLMRHYHVGDLLVVDEPNGKRVPVGIITDRDIIVEVVAEGLNPDAARAVDLITQELVTVTETEGVFETIQRMRFKGVRRVPVVDAQGALTGIVSIDDLLEILAEELTELAKVFSRGQTRERQTRK